MNYSRPILIIQSMSQLPKSSVRTKTLWTDVFGVGSEHPPHRRVLDMDYDGLVGDNGHGSGVSHFVSVSALVGGYLRVKHCLSSRWLCMICGQSNVAQILSLFCGSLFLFIIVNYIFCPCVKVIILFWNSSIV